MIVLPLDDSFIKRARNFSAEIGVLKIFVYDLSSGGMTVIFIIIALFFRLTHRRNVARIAGLDGSNCTLNDFYQGTVNYYIANDSRRTPTKNRICIMFRFSIYSNVTVYHITTAIRVGLSRTTFPPRAYFGDHKFATSLGANSILTTDSYPNSDAYSIADNSSKKAYTHGNLKGLTYPSLMMADIFRVACQAIISPPNYLCAYHAPIGFNISSSFTHEWR
mgnify:CR=1 FL=1